MKTPEHLQSPVRIKITPRLLAAVEASAGHKVPPGARIMLMPPIKALHPGQTCHLCGAKDYDCCHIPGVPF
jgi:hypothetical protein